MTRRFALASALAILAAGLLSPASGQDEADTLSSLKSVSAFATIADDAQRSLALFEEAGKVLTHPRCINCHPAGDSPLQGDDSHPHQPLVVRGEAGIGAPGMYCITCHGAANFDPGGVPGHPRWHLAPTEMAWESKSLASICAQIKDPKRNGGMSIDQLVTHMAEDSLVAWGWAPHAGREPAPGTQQVFGDLIRGWAETGAVCPDE